MPGTLTTNLYIYIFDIDIPGMCNWLFVGIGGLTDDARAHPENGRSIGQGKY